MSETACRAIIERLLSTERPDQRALDSIKVEVCRGLGLKYIPGNAEIIANLRADERAVLLPLLRRKPVRVASGVAVVAVMTSPYPCPKESPCTYCPGGPEQGTPQSYTGHEPAALRGSQNRFDPYLQVTNRIRQLQEIGHLVDKVDLIVMGGTFPSRPISYQTDFIKGCLDGVAGETSSNLEEAKRRAETSRIRNVGITVETRPDWCRRQHVDSLLDMGVTRVEVGVQTVYDDIYRIVERGHSVEDVVEATQTLKDSGLKVCYHMMPGLPGSGRGRDLEAFRTIFRDERFKPDMIKIYPCLVLRGTKLYEEWRSGRYSPYDAVEAAELIAEVKRFIPRWVRVMRVQRDIPAGLIVAGVRKSNLRQLVEERLRSSGWRCECIRCREVGIRWIRDHVAPDFDSIETLIHREKASEGEDLFISVEDIRNNILIGYLRLRYPSERAHRPEIRGRKAAVVRELHVVGPLAPVGLRLKESWQHRGFGSHLLHEAERTAREDLDAEKMLITSALGTKRYYAKLGYAPDGPYMSRDLRQPC
jgi:elongator complex protein 3